MHVGTISRGVWPHSSCGVVGVIHHTSALDFPVRALFKTKHRLLLIGVTRAAVQPTPARSVRREAVDVTVVKGNTTKMSDCFAADFCIVIIRAQTVS